MKWAVGIRASMSPEFRQAPRCNRLKLKPFGCDQDSWSGHSLLLHRPDGSRLVSIAPISASPSAPGHTPILKPEQEYRSACKGVEAVKTP